MLFAHNGWMRYVAASVLIHGALLSIPAAMKAPRDLDPIEVFLVRESNPPTLAARGTHGGSPEGKPHRSSPRFERARRARVHPSQPPIQPAMSKAEPHPPTRENVAGNEPSTSHEPVGPTTVETGVAPGDSPGASGSAGGNRTGSASAGGGEGGDGTGTGGGAGEDEGEGRAGIGVPGGPRFLHREIPTYPFLARRHGKEGNVTLMVVIDPSGRLTKADVVEASDEMFVEPSLEAVRKSTFLPAVRDGRPVGSRALLPIRFSLTR